jgi:hypothetical protein
MAPQLDRAAEEAPDDLMSHGRTGSDLGERADVFVNP